MDPSKNPPPFPPVGLPTFADPDRPRESNTLLLTLPGVAEQIHRATWFKDTMTLSNGAAIEAEPMNDAQAFHGTSPRPFDPEPLSPAAQAVADFDNGTLVPKAVTLRPDRARHVVPQLDPACAPTVVAWQTEPEIFWYDLDAMRLYLRGQLKLPPPGADTGPVPNRGALEEDA